MNILTIADLTIREGRRRRIVQLSTIMGVAFLIVFGVGVHLVFGQIEEAFAGSGGSQMKEEMAIVGRILTLAGLYVSNFLAVIMAVLVSVASVSQEIDTHVIDVVVTKPVRRVEVIIGKWVGFVVMIIGYVVLLAGGVLLISYWRTGTAMHNPLGGLAVLGLNAITVMTLTLAGGTRLSTLANGVVAFMLYGIAFIGGWVETFGALLRNEAAVNFGILASLIMPIEALWKKAALLFQPQALGSPEFSGPFMVTAEPSTAMIVYAVFYAAGLLAFAMWSFARRDL